MVGESVKEHIRRLRLDDITGLEFVHEPAGDRPAGRMAIEVTLPVEQAVRAVPGVVSVRSTTSRGSAEITIDFGWGRDMVPAMLQVESAINQVMPSLPSGTTFSVKRMDPSIDPVLAYSLTSDSRSLTELRDFAYYQLRPLLSTVDGVAKVQVQGGTLEEYRVTVDPARLFAYRLTLGDVARALSAAAARFSATNCTIWSSGSRAMLLVSRIGTGTTSTSASTGRLNRAALIAALFAGGPVWQVQKDDASGLEGEKWMTSL